MKFFHFLTPFCTLFFIILPQALFAQKTEKVSKEELKTWWEKDIEQDSIPGISLDRAYSELLKGKTGKEVIVAVLDTKIDINHEDLKDQIWVNIDEIPGNGIDDDANGYIDDINGWNFLGNSDGQDVAFQQAEVTRIVKKYKSKYEKRTEEDLSEVEKKEYFLFKKASKTFEEDVTEYKGNSKYFDSLRVVFQKANDKVTQLLSRSKFNISEVDSLAKLYAELEVELNYFSRLLEFGDTEESLKKLALKYSMVLSQLYDLDADERLLLKDDPHSLSDVSYGNNILINNSLEFQHSTPVSGLMAATRNNGIGVNGISNHIKIMPVVMVAYGDEYDKEVALAIRYAVDNGADIINMSWGKYFSLHVDWVRDAFRYAKAHNVLLVSGSGNDAKNTDIEIKYPNDVIKGEEFVGNFIIAGGHTHKTDSTLVSNFSNYGKNNVDIFAPASNLYVPDIKDGYQYKNGTSFAAPLTAGAAALLKSYFPKLTAVQLKEILLKSGTKLDILVNRPGDTEGSLLVPFSSLSKTGSILNVYNAIKLAAKME